ncbi:dihydrofolate reductase [Cyclobacteriaceae bacterium]|nr:dihydrofolate reductase [Cyclobacteriaceae bacterium]
MKIAQIVAVSTNLAIGKDNDLIWRLPADLKHFKNITMGHCMLMGRKNFESIGRALPGRTTIIVTRDQNYTQEGCHVVHSIDQGIELAKSLQEEELMIIGGGQIYEQTLPLTSKVYYTEVHEEFEADTFYPKLDSLNWEVMDEVTHQKDEKNKFDYTFKTYIKKGSE